MTRKTSVILLAMIIASFVFASVVMAQEGEKEGLSDDVKKFVALAGGLGIAIAAFGGALAQGRSSAAALEGIARNPGAYQKIFTPLILGLALIESLVIYSLVISFLLVLKL